ncbi:uncharacterized protein LOC123007860 isoform X3 [Tribolium madens]|uniref:uncharacterized protein LOC123007860 isoform X3 n=1 Tax=Tribolium madens TaxID=41895 RepID=UPI001CF74B95|nr:uncharacterized protein LOC123007860 isoform X3 [Tribolium madens]
MCFIRSPIVFNSFLDNQSNFFSSPYFIMPGGRKSGRNTTAIESEKRPNSNPDDTVEPTAGTTSHGKVVGVDGTAAISGNKIDSSSSLFSEIMAKDHFVDKTKIIEVLFGDSKYVLITKPRRFGKSTIMNMVEEFVKKKVYTTGDKVGQEILRSTENDRAFPEMNLRLFEDGNLEISKWDEFSRHRGIISDHSHRFPTDW